MSWEKVRLDDVTDSCLGKMLDQEKNKGDYHPYLANINVRWGSFDLEDLPQMRFEDGEQERYGLKYGDLIICEGGEPGRCAIWKDAIPNMKIQKALHRVRVHDCLDYRYLFYWFLWAGKRGALEQYFTGATIKHMPGQKLKSVVIDKPPIETQRRIADILSSYDDLIENNRKQIKLLEEAAQRLYQEWFVDLRFPGYEHTKIVDGVPEGWEEKEIDDVCLKINAGGTPSRQNKSYYSNGEYRWFKTKELLDCWLIDSEEHISSDGLSNSSAKLFPPHTVVMAIYASPTLGRLGILSEESTTNQAALCLVANENIVSWQWLYQKLFELRDEFNSIAKGAGQQNISSDAVKKKKVIVPSIEIVKKYTTSVYPFFQDMLTLTKQIHKLSEARDRLLPKLMSGEMEVQ